MRIRSMIESNDMATKFVMTTKDGLFIESTYVDYIDKHIICIASQIGCAHRCRFCTNGIASKFRRNLSRAEIIEQCELIINSVMHGNEQDKPILFSIMGCGDPLDNYYEVICSLKQLHEMYPHARFALSTTGLIDAFIPRLGVVVDNFNLKFKLQISLHSANQDIRKLLMPDSGNIDKLMGSLYKYQCLTNKPKQVDYNVVLFDRINDSNDDAKAIANLLIDHGLAELSSVKINRFNSVPGVDWIESNRITEFIDVLHNTGIHVESYKTNGAEIGAACGQLTAGLY